MNPFKYGTIVTGKDFADRKDELKLLIQELTSGQNMILYSPRRYGKSSLMINVLEALKNNGILTAYIDMYGCVFLSDLVDDLVEKTVLPAYGTLEKTSKFLRSAFSGIRPEFTVNSDGSFKVSLKKEVASQGEKAVLDKILDAPEQLAKAKGKPLVVVFDEFQEIVNLDGDVLENLMRSHFQHHEHVSYVFMGSKRHILEEIFEDANRPFYRFAKPFPLGKIPIKEFKQFITTKFEETNIHIDSATIDLMLKFTDGHPYFTQQLCHELWNLAYENKTVKEVDVTKAIQELLRIHKDLFVKQWDTLTIHQKKLLVGLSWEERVTKIYASSFIEKYELISSSHVYRAMEPLLKDGTVEKIDDTYSLTDVFFKEWVKSKTRGTTSVD
ncbi:MAG: ATP-binding protein [Candidatus Bathyarchaeota archaeon]|nr:ATP-binding protein [Candidatus Bathyarchaeum sp.]